MRAIGLGHGETLGELRLADFLERLFELATGDRLSMPAVLIFQERDALAP